MFKGLQSVRITTSILAVALSFEQFTYSQVGNLWIDETVVDIECRLDWSKSIQAYEQGDYVGAANSFNEIADKLPGLTIAELFEGLCLLRNSQFEEGRKAVDSALKLEQSLDNLLSVVHVLDEANGPAHFFRDYLTQAVRLVEESSALGPEPNSLGALAKFCIEHEDPLFRRVVDILTTRFPDSLEAHYFKSIVAIHDGHWITAEKELLEAGRLGLSPVEIDAAMDAGLRTRATIWWYVYLFAILIGVWVCGLLLLFLMGKALSQLVLRSLRVGIRSGDLSLRERLVRKLYRIVVNFAGISYYASLPIVFLLAVGLPAALIYGMLLLPVVHPGLIFLVASVGFFSAYCAVDGLVTSLGGKNVPEASRELSRDEAPALWDLAAEVASHLGIRSIDAIHVVAGAEIAVREEGSILDKLRDQGQQTLILGLSALQGLKQGALRAIVAHELAHFANRDTAGGDIALRVRVDMSRFADSMAEQGMISSWNIALRFLELYCKLFRRISFGASRLQEIFADRIAVCAYGAQAFEEGLIHVVRQKVKYDFAFASSIRDGLRNELAPANFYSRLETQNDDDKLVIDLTIAELLGRPSTDDDTHPGCSERFALAQHLQGTFSTPSEALVVSDLFVDFTSITEEFSRELTELVEHEVRMRDAMIAENYEVLSTCLVERPTSLAYEERGIASAYRGMRELALKDFDQAIELDSKASRALLHRGLIYMEAREFTSAIEDFQSSLTHSVDWRCSEEYYSRAYCLLLLGDCYLQLQQYAEAIEAFTAACDDDPSILFAVLKRGTTYLAMCDSSSAINDFSYVVEKYPWCAVAYKNRGFAYESRGELQKAIEDYRRAIQFDSRLKEISDRLSLLSPSQSVKDCYIETPLIPFRQDRITYATT